MPKVVIDYCCHRNNISAFSDFGLSLVMGRKSFFYLICAGIGLLAVGCGNSKDAGPIRLPDPKAQQVREGNPSWGRCLWLSPDGKQCSAKQWRRALFATWQGPVIGCKSTPGKVTLQGKPSSKKPWISLTFDDGPSSWTPAYLDLLNRHHIKATFFLVGSQVQANPALTRRILREGHMLANHSWDHPMLTSSTTNIQAQLYNTQQTIQQISGFRPCLMRPPYGAWNQAVQKNAKRSKLQIINWDADSQDWRRPGVGAITRNVLSSAQNGTIVLMHDGGGDRSQGLAALPGIIQAMRKRGFRFTRLDRILEVKLVRAGSEPVQ